MKLLEADKEKFVFRLARREKALLLGVLKLYPVVPPAHHRVSKRLPAERKRDTQGLLDEALAEQRTANKRQLETFMSDPARFEEKEAGVRMTVKSSDFEWLLQVLNDIRIGSWILLGSPNEGSKPVEVNSKTAQHFWAMEMSGFFQMSLLAAIEGGKTSSL